MQLLEAAVGVPVSDYCPHSRSLTGAVAGLTRSSLWQPLGTSTEVSTETRTRRVRISPGGGSTPCHPFAVDAHEVDPVGHHGVVARPAADDVEAAVARVDRVVVLAAEETVAASAAGDAIRASQAADRLAARSAGQPVGPRTARPAALAWPVWTSDPSFAPATGSSSAAKTASPSRAGSRRSTQRSSRADRRTSRPSTATGSHCSSRRAGPHPGRNGLSAPSGRP